ncbi:MAG: hypothetical protein MUP31_04945, partial [Xanthomonadales bacterium]|nr:hypothetical protein [Xanthomonadales bacterium]
MGITERAVQKIVRDLQHEGFLTISKQGRCNRYTINNRKTLRHSLQSQCTVGKLLNLVSTSKQAPAKVEIEDQVQPGEPAIAPIAKKSLPEPPAESTA